jgi:hypothetical protein
MSKQLNTKQLDWVRRMRSNLSLLHTQWYGWNDNQPVRGGMDRELFHETDRKIRLAADRLGIEVECAAELAEQNEGWDGELNGSIVVLENALRRIETGESDEQRTKRLQFQNPQWQSGRRF